VTVVQGGRRLWCQGEGVWEGADLRAYEVQ
jgi:hypothetical protein